MATRGQRILGCAAQLFRGSLVAALTLGVLWAQDPPKLADLYHRASELRKIYPGLGAAERGDLEVEVAEIERGLRGFLESSDAEDRPVVLVAMNWVLRIRGRWSEGLGIEQREACFKEAVSAAREIGKERLLSSSQRDHARFLSERGDLEEAILVLEDSLAELAADSGARLNLLDALANVRLQARRFGPALTSLEEYESLLGPAAGHRSLAALHGLRGQTYLEMGLVDRAAAQLTLEMGHVEHLMEEGPDRHQDVIGCYLRQVNLAYASGRYRRAVGLTDAFLGDRERLESFPQWEATLVFLRGLALAHGVDGDGGDGGRRESARAQLDRAVEREDLVPRDRRMARIALARIHVREGALQEAGDLLNAARPPHELADQRALPEHLTWLEVRGLHALRSEASADSLGALRDELRAALDEHLALWQTSPTRPGGMGLLNFPSRRRWLARCIELDLALESTAAEALEVLLQAQASGTLSRSVPWTSELARAFPALLLEPREGLLVYLPGAENTHLFVADSGGVDHWALASEFDWEQDLGDLRRGLEASGRGGSIDAVALAKSAQGLADRLLPAEVAHRVGGWEKLTVVGNDLLGSVPFEVLPGSDGQSLGQSHGICELPSIPLGVQRRSLMRRRASRPGNGLLFIGATQPDPSLLGRWPHLSELDVDRNQLASLLEPYPGEQVDLLFGEDANPERLGLVKWRDYSVLQFLGHGLRDARLERPGGLALAAGPAGEPGLWTCADVDGLEGPGLVLLHACSVGAGPLRAGDEELGHLGGAWLGAGADSVLLAESDQRLDRTLDLIAALHAGLAKGLAPSMALRDARRSLASEGAGAGAYDLGRLRLIGLGHQPLFPRAMEVEDGDTDGPAERPIDLRWVLGLGLAGLLLSYFFLSRDWGSQSPRGRGRSSSS